MIDIDELKQLADIRTVLAYYGIYPDNKNLIHCISHTDNNPSMVVYPKTNSVHCFACGADFDSIGVVMHIEECSFRQACDRLRDMFGISDNKHSDIDIRRRLKAKQAEKLRIASEKYEWQQKFNFLTNLHHALRDISWSYPEDAPIQERLIPEIAYLEIKIENMLT